MSKQEKDLKKWYLYCPTCSGNKWMVDLISSMSGGKPTIVICAECGYSTYV